MKVIALHGFTCPGNDLPLTFHSTRSYCLFQEVIMNKTSTGPKMFQLGYSAEVISQTEVTHIFIHSTHCENHLFTMIQNVTYS